jgi:hypothetical protein
MSEPRQKTAVVFRPKRQWKPKRRDRNISQRIQRKRWWKKNKRRFRHKRAIRRRLLKNNSLFKSWRKHRQSQKGKRRMRFGFEEVFRQDQIVSLDRGKDPAPETIVPEVGFIFPHETEAGRMNGIDLGYLADYDPDNEEFLVYDASNDSYRGVDFDDFYGTERDDLDLIPEEKEAPALPEDDLPEEEEEVLETGMVQPPAEQRDQWSAAGELPGQVVEYPRPILVAARWLKDQM